MEQFVVTGQKRLVGEVLISGAKNAVVAIIPSAIVAKGVSIIDNLPSIEDVKSLIKTLESLGAKCEFISESCLKIDSTNISTHCAINGDVKKMRASYYLMGALLARFKKAEILLPGGCDFGERPIDQHLRGFQALGAKIEQEGDIIKLSAQKLRGAYIYLDMASVGATINLMIAATLAEGTTIIENPAKEPHVVDTANFLNMLGANIKGAGTDIIKIVGVEGLRGGEYTIIPDQIEAGTYMIASAMTGGDVTVKNIIPKHMDCITAKLTEMGCKISEGDDYLRVVVSNELVATNVKTMSYPGFPTDLQPQMTALLSVVNGYSELTENVWKNRFQYVSELNKLGTNITVDGRTAKINGVHRLNGGKVFATDLRAGAALILAGLHSKTETHIKNVLYIQRGYSKLEEKLASLGANIKLI